mmetsp:Transcript_4792/g.8831  ORF Transcript_4792/g.8831 Transcript_4792/m.8831 type:complete len:783 (+) Transcript_4792:19-2367(+)
MSGTGFTGNPLPKRLFSDMQGIRAVNLWRQTRFRLHNQNRVQHGLKLWAEKHLPFKSLPAVRRNSFRLYCSQSRPSIPDASSPSLFDESSPNQDVHINPSVALQITRDAPEKPGVYIFRDQFNEILYIGKAKVLKKRLASYLKPDHIKTATMIKSATTLDFIVTKTEQAALTLEAQLVYAHQPRFNVLLRDDRKFPFVKITFSEEYPRLVVARKRWKLNIQDNSSKSSWDVDTSQFGTDKYYGPFTDSGQLARLLQTIHMIFRLRQRNTPLFKDRVCMNYHVKKCDGVCQRLVSPEEYKIRVKRAEMVLQGRINEILDELNAMMRQAARELQFEYAAELRDRCKQLVQTLAGLRSVESVASQNLSLNADIVISKAAPDHSVVIVLLVQIRAGQIFNKLSFITKPASGLAHSTNHFLRETMQQVMQRHYLLAESDVMPPETCFVNVLPIDASSFTEHTQHGTRIYHIPDLESIPADYHDLYMTIDHNADLALQDEISKLHAKQDRINDLASLVESVYITSSSPNSWLKRIECFDISHTNGTHAIASRAVFINGKPAPHLYKTYEVSMSELGHPDDYRCLEEAVRRRLASNTGNDEWPGLMLIDGGKGQLSAVQRVFQEMGILAESRLKTLVDEDVLQLDIENGDSWREIKTMKPSIEPQRKVALLSLAKREEEVFAPNMTDAINDGMSPGVLLLCEIRDEAHKLAITKHRFIRNKNMFSGSLHGIVGLGPAKREALLAAFDWSYDKLRTASVSEIMSVPGIGKSLAEKIQISLHASSASESNL